MYRFLTGLMLAAACHIMFFWVPMYRDTVRLPQAKGITVRFRPLAPPTPQKVAKKIPPPPAPITPFEKRIEKPAHKKVTPPKPKPKKRSKIVKKKKGKEPKPLRPSPPEDLKEQPQPEPQPKIMPNDFSVAKPVQNLTPLVHPTDTKPLPVAKIAPLPVRKAYPKNVGNPPPKYPVLARRRGWEGTVELMVMVLEDGTVGEITVEKSSGYPLLDEAALKTVSTYQFIPGLRGGKTLAMRVKVPVHFQLRSD